MASTTTMTPQPLSTAELEEAGLTGDQVARLIERREGYCPFHEFFNQVEFRRLRFLRWRIEHGRIGAIQGA